MEIKEFLFQAQEQTDFCQSFIYRPSNIEEEKLGWLLMTGRMRNVPETSFYLLNLLASRIKREYFSNLRRSPSRAFEMALQVGRNVLKENEKRVDWLLNLDFLIAAIFSMKVQFSFIGKMEVLVIRTNKENEIIDLDQKIISEKNVLFPLSIFSQVKLRKNDILVFGTKNLCLKEKLLKTPNEIFPFDEKKLRKVIKVEESAVALVINTSQPNLLVTQKLKKIKKTQKPSLKMHLVKEKFKAKVFAFYERIKKLFLKIKGASRNFSQLKIPIRFQKPRFSKKTFFSLSGIFIGVILLLVLFIFKQSIFQKVKVIEDLKLKAESSLFYSNKKEAAFYLKKALKLIEGIKKENEKIKELKREIEKELGILLAREKVENPELLFEIKEKLSKWKPEGMIASRNEIYLWSFGSNLVFRWNIPLKEGVFIPLEIEKVDGAVFVKERPIFIDKKGKISIIGKKIELKLPKIEIQKIEGGGFNEYFYIFDKKNGEILKFRLEEAKKILEGSFWFKERGAGEGAKSFAIDGRIYLLFDNKIEKFLRGKKEKEFPIPESFPAVKNLTKIFTSKENRYLYLFEAGEKRIMILKKDGQKIKEYFLPSLESPKDFWVSFDDKTIYLLDGNKVFKIENKIK